MIHVGVMGTLVEIEKAVKELPSEELKKFREWFLEFDADAWDQQFEQDAKAGRLDALANEALDDLKSGRCSER